MSQVPPTSATDTSADSSKDVDQEKGKSSERSSDLTTERQFVRKMVNASIRWMPSGITGFAFASFLLQQEWVLAVLTFPVTLFLAIWGAYIENFIAQMRQIYAERARNDADALVKFLDWLDQSLISSFAKSPEAKYLQCQGNECLYNDTEGYRQPDDIKTPLLQDVFVPLELSGSFSRDVEGNAWSFQMGSRDPLLKKQLRGESLSIWELLRQSRTHPAYRRIAILAWGGFGKTTLMRHLAYTYGNNCQGRYRGPKLVPVLLYLRKWRDVIAKGETDLATLIHTDHLPSLPGGKKLNLSKQWVENMLGKNALVLIDGFDEVAEKQRPAVSRWISDQMRTYDQAVFILTSRPLGYSHYSGEKRPTTTVFVQPFKPAQWQQFIHQWYGCQERRNRAESVQHRQVVAAIAEEKATDLITQLEQREELAQMATNPLLLNMIATFHRFHPSSELPKRRTALYQAICRLQLGARPDAKRVEMGLDPEDSQQILQWLALEMGKQAQQTQIESGPLLELLGDYLTALDETLDAKLLLKRIAEVSELLVEKEPGQYEFSHRSFQSYLAAMELKRQGQEGWLLDQWQDEWWQETILLYGALVKNPTSLLQGLVDRNAADLAYRCLQETPRLVDPELAASLERVAKDVGVLRYQALENYLKNGEWKEADQETYRLMITKVGKETGQWFTQSELLDFDCKELLTIDALWVKYSDGKFGFSVQKDLYVNCGGILDGKYHKEAWEKFCYANGWKEGGRYVFDRIKYDFDSARSAHLPIRGVEGFAVGVMVGGRWRRMVGILFSRIQTCKL
ncbi:MAG: NACHT domain-containing protein [Merismopedia sp. SIO2A8]|nr:NACHT domain-containing protein [Merismopedia sp. SIO2A8]